MAGNLQTPKSTKVTAITSEIKKILGTIIFRARLAKGWNGYDQKTQDMAIASWFEILSIERVPPQFFDELYRRACNFQAHVIQSGKEPPEMSAQLMLAQWVGAAGLQAEIRARAVAAKNQMPETAESCCPRCFGTGVEYVYSPSGENLGCRPKCAHIPLQPGEWLFENLE